MKDRSSQSEKEWAAQRKKEAYGKKQEKNVNLNIDFSDSDFENFEITTSALCISTQTTQSIRIITFSSARMN